MIKKEPPCNGCLKRSSTCHIEGNCKEHDEWKKEDEQRKASIKEASLVDSMYNCFRINCRDAALRKSSSHGYYS